MALLVLLGALAAWTARAGGRPGPELTLLAAVAGAYVVGRLVGVTRTGRTLGLLLIAGSVTYAVLTAADGLSGRPLAGPVGYGNANGAICTLSGGAVLVAGFTWRPLLVRLASIVAAGGLTWIALQTGSMAATGLSAALVLLALVLLTAPSLARAAPVLAALALLVSIGGTVALALGSGSENRRVVLWGEALDLVRSAPVDGVGVNGFATLAPTAVADADARWAHSVWLQQAAETGWPGFGLLLVAGLLAVIAVQIRTPRVGAAGAIGAATVGALFIHSSIDYVLSFAIVSVLTSTFLGLCVVAQRDEDHPVAPTRRRQRRRAV